MSDHPVDPSIGDGRTAVLLGAGASADAGLLLTSGLAAAIIEKANRAGQSYYDQPKPDWVRALNAVYAGMVGYKGARGEDPLSAVNIETLVSAVRLLRNRDDHEVAPFVASWAPALSGFGSSELPQRSGQAILDAVGKELGGRASFAARNVTEAVAEIAKSVVRPDLVKPFATAETFILNSLVELLGAHQDVSYFEPLLELAREQGGGVDVITLNYDMTVETAAKHAGVTVNRGIDSWHPGEPLNFPPAEGVLNLMKLHGSLDWRVTAPGDEYLRPVTPRRIDVVEPEQLRDGSAGNLPWIVVGDREKLATDGPTLALNFAARAALLRSKHLAVVGYSFGDAHINAMIRDWLGGDSERSLSILDVSFPREHGFRPNLDFRSALIARYGRQRQGPHRFGFARVLPVEGTASERLSEALQGRPKPEPDPLVTVSATREPDALRLEITWHGFELADVTLGGSLPTDTSDRYSAPRGLPLFKSVPLPDGSASLNWAQTLRYEKWVSQSTMIAYASATTPLPIELKIDGASIVGAQSWHGLISDDLHTTDQSEFD